MLVRSSFDHWAGSYDESPLQALLFGPVQSVVIEQLRLHAPRGGRLLDVGCGTGRLLASAGGKYRRCVGIDPSLEMLDGARDLGLQDTWWVCARAERLPFRSNAFDVVTSTMSLRHWQDVDAGLRELARVLSPGGVLVLADADFDTNDHPRSWRRRHVSASRGCRLATLVSGCGLDVVEFGSAPVRGPAPSVHVVSARPR